jgi:hypothetical protein
VADSKDAVNISVHKLQTISSKYGVNISKRKTKAKAFKKRDPMISKIVMNSDIIEEINTFTYPICSNSYQNGRDISGKKKNSCR